MAHVVIEIDFDYDDEGVEVEGAAVPIDVDTVVDIDSLKSNILNRLIMIFIYKYLLIFIN
jgi:hypothetical protein